MPDALVLPVREIVHETPRCRILRLDLGDQPFAYRPGQAVMLGRHGQPVRKPYSLASAPEQVADTQQLEVLVQIGILGKPEPHLDGLEVGTPIDVEGPMGSFCFPSQVEEPNLLFIAGGTGIAPLRAMLWHSLLSNGSKRIGVLYSARTPEEFAYGAELRELASRDRITLRRTVTRSDAAGWTEGRGRLGMDELSAMVNGPDTLCFICGPDSLVRDVEPMLLQLGISRQRIRAERWGSSG